MCDLVTFGETMLRYATAPGDRLETAESFSVHVGGAESNVAVAASRLGIDTVWLSKLADTPLGHRITQTLQTHGVTPDVVWTDEGRQGIYYFEPGPTPRQSRVLYDRQQAAITTATPTELATERIVDAESFYVSGITPALSETLSKTTATLLETAQQHDTQSILDVNYRSKLWSPEQAAETLTALLPLVDVLVIAQRDAATVFDHADAPETVGQTFRDMYAHDLVIVTRGDQGAVAVTDNAVVEQPAFAADTIDAVGTGDAFVGGFLSQWLATASLAQALEYGAAAAAVNRTLRGDLPVVSPTDIAAVIDDDRDIAR